MTTDLCYTNYKAGDFYPRDPVFLKKSIQHELTHCATIVAAINQANEKVQNSGWFSTFSAANSKKQQIINETASEWSAARLRVLGDQDVAGQVKTTLEGDCYIERQTGTW